MWYAILPTTSIIFAALSAPIMYAYFSNKIVLGQPYRRVITEKNAPFMFLRDARLNENLNSYEYNGLDNIPDLEVSQNK